MTLHPQRLSSTPRAPLERRRVVLAAALPAAILVALAVPAGAQGTPGACVSDLSIVTNHDARIVTLTWTATPGAASYDVHRSVNGGPSEHVATLPATGTTFVDSPAPEGVLEYRVAADGHPTPDCPAVATHIGGEPVPPGEAVCASGLVAVANADGSVTLRWEEVPGTTNYEILRAAGDGALAPFTAVSGTLTSFTDATTVPGQAFRYAVVANGLPPPGVQCEEVTVTAIPFFPNAAYAALAVLGALGVVSLLRRRS